MNTCIYIHTHYTHTKKKDKDEDEEMYDENSGLEEMEEDEGNEYGVTGTGSVVAITAENTPGTPKNTVGSHQKKQSTKY